MSAVAKHISLNLLDNRHYSYSLSLVKKQLGFFKIIKINNCKSSKGKVAAGNIALDQLHSESWKHGVENKGVTQIKWKIFEEFCILEGKLSERRREKGRGRISL